MSDKEYVLGVMRKLEDLTFLDFLRFSRTVHHGSKMLHVQLRPFGDYKYYAAIIMMSEKEIKDDDAEKHFLTAKGRATEDLENAISRLDEQTKRILNIRDKSEPVNWRTKMAQYKLSYFTYLVRTAGHPAHKVFLFFLWGSLIVYALQLAGLAQW